MKNYTFYVHNVKILERDNLQRDYIVHSRLNNVDFEAFIRDKLEMNAKGKLFDFIREHKSGENYNFRIELMREVSDCSIDECNDKRFNACRNAAGSVQYKCNLKTLERLDCKLEQVHAHRGEVVYLLESQDDPDVIKKLECERDYHHKLAIKLASQRLELREDLRAEVSTAMESIY